MLDLKNCPFCGNDGSGPIEDALHIHHNEPAEWNERHTWTVQCDKCTATMGYFDSEDDAIAAWNRRALQAVGPEPVAQISDEIVDAVREAYRRKVAEYDRDFRDPAMSGEPWKTKYGTNLHSTSLGEQWAMSQALRSALVATPPAETVVEALALALELIERSSFQWTGAGPHPQVVVEKLRALAAKDGRS